MAPSGKLRLCTLVVAALFYSALAFAQQPSASTDNTRVLLWRTHLQGQSLASRDLAEQLLFTSPDDPLAASVLLSSGATKNVKPFELAERALERYSEMRNPGLDAGGFYQMQRFVSSTLSAAVGEAYLARRQYKIARPFLQRAVDIHPNNGRFVYSLAQAYLSGEDPELKQGYWYLARAVNLTRGGPGGEQIAAYARSRYVEDGGTSENWDQFLASAGAPASAAGSPTVAARTTAPTTAAPSAAPGQSASVTPNSAPVPRQTVSPTTTAPAATAPTPAAPEATVRTPEERAGSPRTPEASARPAASPEVAEAKVPRPTPAPPRNPEPDRRAEREDDELDEEASEEERSEDERRERLAALRERLERPAPGLEAPRPSTPAPKPAVQAGAPVSIGVVIQTEMADGSSRKAVVNGLSDMVRRLRDDDEAFVLSFGQSMVLEEDLTSNSESLERAMDEISGDSGTALYDAVSFSAGHLARIAKNRNRALLLISDGSVATSTVSTFQASQEIENSGVRIFCIGIDVASTEDQRRLMTLASNTGGQALFVSSPNQFRSATRSIASKLGVPF